MSLPRIFFIVPGLVAGMLLPAVGAAPQPAPASTVGMLDELFDGSAVTVHCGDRLTRVNSSGLLHVIGPGRRGRVITRTPGVPVVGFHLMETNGVDTTDRWESPGTYYLTCLLHPKMTLKASSALEQFTRSLTAPSGWTCTTPAKGKSGTVTCTAATMQSNTSSASSIVVKVSAKANGSVNDIVSVSSDTDDPDNSNNQASAATSVVR